MLSTKRTLDGLTNESMIQITGYPDPKPYGKIKDAVIYLGGQFFFKDDTDHLVRVRDSNGKKKIFRKNSKLVQEISPGNYVHISNLIKTEDGIFLDKNDPNTVLVNGKPTRREFTVEIGGKYYLRTDPTIKICTLSSTYVLEKDAILLSKEYYPKAKYVAPSYKNHLVQIDGEWVIKQDTLLMYNKEGEEQHYHKNYAASKERFNVFHKFKDVTNPQLDRIDVISMFVSDKGMVTSVDEIGYYVHNKYVNDVRKLYNDVILVREAKKTADLKKALKYMDDGPDENQAKVVEKIPQPWPGKYNVHTPRDMGHVISKTTKLTGGLKYTFGLEIETSQGIVPTQVVDKLKIKIVGDRSIGAGEYVSGVLHGDDGINLVKAQCEAIAKYCFVDDRCGIHVHIGGMDDKRNVADGDFDREFAINAIKLGCQLEEELYKSCPESRQPTLKHCHSIKRWHDITPDVTVDGKKVKGNWREYLGAYVFGPEENWKNPWSFAAYPYGEGRNKQVKVDTWCGGRYKWLNLVHILSKSSFCTCELRLFPGSTNFDKIYNYILTSMAFVWFIENKPALIAKGGVTLSLVFEKAFKDYPEIIERLNTFYKQRTARFNRKNLYPASIPKAIL